MSEVERERERDRERECACGCQCITLATIDIVQKKALKGEKEKDCNIFLIPFLCIPVCLPKELPGV